MERITDPIELERLHNRLHELSIPHTDSAYLRSSHEDKELCGRVELSTSALSQTNIQVEA